MLDAKKFATAIAGKISSVAPPESESFDPFQMAAEDLIAAVKDGDAVGVAAAMRAGYSASRAEEDQPLEDEEEEVTDHGVDNVPE